MTRETSRRPALEERADAGFDLQIIDKGEMAIKAIKILRHHTGLELHYLKDYVINKEVLRLNITKAHGELILKELEANKTHARMIYSRKVGQDYLANWALSLHYYQSISLNSYNKEEEKNEQLQMIKSAKEFLAEYGVNMSLGQITEIAKSGNPKIVIKRNIPLHEANDLKGKVHKDSRRMTIVEQIK